MLKHGLLVPVGFGSVMLLWRLLGTDHNDSDGDEEYQEDKTHNAQDDVTSNSAGQLSRSATPGPAQLESSAVWTDASSQGGTDEHLSGCSPNKAAPEDPTSTSQQKQQQQIQQHNQQSKQETCSAQPSMPASDSFRSACSLALDDADDACSSSCQQQQSELHNPQQLLQGRASASPSPARRGQRVGQAEQVQPQSTAQQIQQDTPAPQAQQQLAQQHQQQGQAQQEPEHLQEQHVQQLQQQQQHPPQQLSQQDSEAGLFAEVSNGHLSNESLEDEQVAFLPVQLPLALDNISGSWQQPADSSSTAAAAAGAGAGAVDDATVAQQRLSWPDDFSQSPSPPATTEQHLPLQGQQSGLQPINMAAADAEGRAMTEQQWRTVCTVAYSPPDTLTAAAAAAGTADAGAEVGGSSAAAAPAAEAAGTATVQADTSPAPAQTAGKSGVDAGTSSRSSSGRRRAKGSNRSPLLARLPSDIVPSGKPGSSAAGVSGRPAAAAAAANGSTGFGVWGSRPFVADSSSSGGDSSDSSSSSDIEGAEAERPGTSRAAAAAAAAVPLSVAGAGSVGSSRNSGSPSRTAALSQSPQSPFASENRQQEVRLAEVQQQQQQQQQQGSVQGAALHLRHSSSAQAGSLSDWPSLQVSGLSAVWQQPSGPLSPRTAAAAAADAPAAAGGDAAVAAAAAAAAAGDSIEAAVRADTIATALADGEASQLQQQQPQALQQHQQQQERQQSLQRLPSFAADPELQQQLAVDVLGPAAAAVDLHLQPKQGLLLASPTVPTGHAEVGLTAVAQQHHSQQQLSRQSAPPQPLPQQLLPQQQGQQAAARQEQVSQPSGPAAAGDAGMSAAAARSKQEKGRAKQQQQQAPPCLPPQLASEQKAQEQQTQQQGQQRHDLGTTPVSVASTANSNPAGMEQRPSTTTAAAAAAAAAAQQTPAVQPSTDGTVRPSAAAAAASSVAAPPAAVGAAAGSSVAAPSAVAAVAMDAPWLRLVVSAGPATGQQFEAHTRRQELVIGRNPVAWCSIPDQEVSGKHASLRWSESHNAWQVADAGSLNGTFINGTSIARPNRQPGVPTSLKHGDQLHLGSVTRVTVECSGSNSTPSSPQTSPSKQTQGAASAAAAAAAGAEKGQEASGIKATPSDSRQTQVQQQQQQQWRPTLELRNQQQEQHVHRGDTLGPAAAALRRQQHHHHPLQQQQQQQSVLHTVPAPLGSFPAVHGGSTATQQHCSAAGGSTAGSSSTDRQEAAAHEGSGVKPHAPNSSSGSGSAAAGVGPLGRHASRLSACSSNASMGPLAAGAIGPSAASTAAGAATAAATTGGSVPGRVPALLAPVILLQFLTCRVEGAVAKMVGADHRRKCSPCEDVVAWRTPLGDCWPQLGLFCVFDGHNSRNASEQAQQLLPDYLAESLTQQQQRDAVPPLQQPPPPQQQQRNGAQSPQQQPEQQQKQAAEVQDLGGPQQEQQQQDSRPMLSNEVGVAAALTASFLATDAALVTDDGCTATAVLLEGCGDRGVLLRVANVGDSLALLVNLTSAGWRVLTEDHRIAVNAAEAARLRAKNTAQDRANQRFWGLNIARMLGDRFLKEQDVGFTAEPYVSEGLRIDPQDEALLVVASDGLWDVVSPERVAALAAKAAAAAAGDVRAAGSVVTASGSLKAAGSSSGQGLVAGSQLQEDGSGAAGGSLSGDGSVSSRRGGGCVGSASGSGGQGPPRKTVAAAVADELMLAALRLHSKDDISIMVLNVLPAAVADVRRRVEPHGSSSGSM